jgi:hypothetical protein
MVGDSGAGGTRGAAPAPAAGDAAALKVLRADGTWASANDPDAIHDNVAGEIAAITEKLNPTAADYLLIEDTAAADVKKRVFVGNLPAISGTSYRQTAMAQIAVATSTTATSFPALTTIAALSNGVALPTGTINVASTTGFAAAGTLYVETTAGMQTVTYTGTTATTFTGCAGGTGTMATGGRVAAVTAQDWLTVAITTLVNAILLVRFSAHASNSNANRSIFFRLVIDGVVIAGSQVRMVAASNSGAAVIAIRISKPTAGTRKIVVQARVNANTGRIDPVGSPESEHGELVVEEVTV